MQPAAKNNNILFLLLLTIVTVAVSTGNNTYIQFFSDIIESLNIESEDANYLIRLNIVGMLIVSFIAGPLSDIYGRRKIFMFGLFLYIMSSSVCYYFISRASCKNIFFFPKKYFAKDFWFLRPIVYLKHSGI